MTLARLPEGDMVAIDAGSVGSLKVSDRFQPGEARNA